MDADQRVRLAIGDLVVQLHIAMAKVEELQKELDEVKAKKERSKNGGK